MPIRDGGIVFRRLVSLVYSMVLAVHVLAVWCFYGDVGVTLGYKYFGAVRCSIHRVIKVNVLHGCG